MLTRRDFLGTSLSFALPSLSRRRRVRGVLWLWMQGGMSQAHTWDPRPDAQALPRAIDTAVPGIRVSGLLPLCASQMHHLALVRTVSHGFGAHDVAAYFMHTGHPPHSGDDYPSIGNVLAAELGPPDFPLPKYAVLGPFSPPSSALLGEENAPVRVPLPGLLPNVTRERDAARAELVLEQNREWSARRQVREARKHDLAFRKSEALMNSRLLNAFNVDEEPEGLRKEYGDGFGRDCLLGRRLVQAGCPFVEISLAGWKSSPSYAASVLDRGLGTLIKDLAAKDLLKEILVVCATEFGKAPRPAGGPWPRAFSVALAGGPIQGGRVLGDTGSDGTECSFPVSAADLFATIYCACGVDWEKAYPAPRGKRPYVKDGIPLEWLL